MTPLNSICSLALKPRKAFGLPDSSSGFQGWLQTPTRAFWGPSALLTLKLLLLVRSIPNAAGMRLSGMQRNAPARSDAEPCDAWIYPFPSGNNPSGCCFHTAAPFLPLAPSQQDGLGGGCMLRTSSSVPLLKSFPFPSAAASCFAFK